ncbi:G-protein coupled receptor [Oratosquilla oratoria]|uniref:G-protein coupled receptor n=1 Tax=Oratosquilla oratoria TaxID=337810 RepID=UPI003F7622CA
MASSPVLKDLLVNWTEVTTAWPSSLVYTLAPYAPTGRSSSATGSSSSSSSSSYSSTLDYPNSSNALLDSLLSTSFPAISSTSSSVLEEESDVQQELVSSSIRGIMDSIQMWVTPLLVIFGAVGNLVSIWVFHATKLRTLSSSCYLAALAASDTGYLMTLFLVWLSLVGEDVYNREGWCQAITYFTSASTFLSVWLVVAFTVERFIAVCYPLLRTSICTVRRARTVIAILTIVALLLYSYTLLAAGLEWDKDSKRPMCTARREYLHVSSAMNHVDTLLTLVLPVITIVVLNVRIARCVWHVEKLRHSMTAACATGPSPPQTLTATDSGGTTPRTTSVWGTPVSRAHDVGAGPLNNSGGCGGVGGGSAGGGGCGGGSGSSARAMGTRLRSQNKVTKMLLIISTVFILLNLPSFVMRPYIYFKDLHCKGRCEHSSIEYVVQQAFVLLFNTNFAINFLLYCVSGQNFRRAVKSLCCHFRRRHHLYHSHQSHSQPHSHSLRDNRQTSINQATEQTRRSPLSRSMKTSGGMVINIQLWNGHRNSTTTTTTLAYQQSQRHHHQLTCSRSKTHYPTTPNGVTHESYINDKEDSF